jgi:hypothetical protein
MRCVSTLVLLIAGMISAQTSDKLLATELIAMLKSLKDVYAEAGRLAPITIRLVNEMPTWDNERLNREFEAFWNAANAETSSETVQGALYKTSTFLFRHPKYGEDLARTRINDVLDAIEATAKLKRTSLVEHTLEIKIRNLPEATITRMAKLSNTIDAYPGSLLMQATAAADAANPAALEVIRSLLSKPANEKYAIYGWGTSTARLRKPRTQLCEQ